MGLKQPRNHKFEIGYAQAKSPKPQTNMQTLLVAGAFSLVLILKTSKIPIPSSYYTNM